MRCADFGCNVGGFTDCLLQRGAAHVVAMDTGYGTLAWKLRQDARVTVRERENALHAAVPGEAERVDLVVIDMGWTPQRLCVPVAVMWLKPGGRIIHMSPANNYANHGFYQFSPTLYADYYRANRFENVRVFAVEERLRGDETASWDLFELEPGRQPLMMTSATRRRMLTLCIAERGAGSTVSNVPIQSSYEIEFEKNAARSDDGLASQEPKLWFNRLA